ncbi:MAG: hypothetical protein JXR94_04355 [Candidatus Hydrogenedentes bacterium]|nr:hypothetical protein [Candidatus Hydrogenedentota bacterium]
MKRLCGAFAVICGLVITGCKIQELVTGTLTHPLLLVVGPLFLIGGIGMVGIESTRRARNEGQ